MLIFFCIKRTFAHFGQKTEVSDLNGLYFSIKSSKLYVYLLIYTHEIYSIIFIIIIFLIKINIRLISIIPWNRERPTSPKPNTVREVHVAITVGLAHCWYRILSAFDLHVRPLEIQKYYFLSIGPWEHLGQHGVTRSDNGAPEVPF